MTGRSVPLTRWLGGRLWELCSHGCTLQYQVLRGPILTLLSLHLLHAVTELK